MASLNWFTDSAFSVAGERFQCCNTIDEMTQHHDRDGFVIGKSTILIEHYARQLDELEPKRIVELGIFRGGGTVFFHVYCRPIKMLALDVAEEPVPTLERYREKLNDDSLTTRYGIDQSDAETLPGVLDEYFGGSALDLVVDDASHMSPQTQASFNMLFPRLRPGGLYIIEDWAWIYDLANYPHAIRASAHGQLPLSRMAFELVSLAGVAPTVIKGLSFNQQQILVSRGREELNPKGFDYSSYVDLSPEKWAAPVSSNI